jgi:hypothetical protein
MIRDAQQSLPAVVGDSDRENELHGDGTFEPEVGQPSEGIECVQGKRILIGANRPWVSPRRLKLFQETKEQNSRTDVPNY